MSAIENRVQNPDREWRQWNRDEIFNGTSTSVGLMVPNPNDLVFDIPSNMIWKVVSVDYTTGISTLIEWNNRANESVNSNDRFLSSGADNETFRVYVDTSVVPYVLAFDTSMHTYNSDASYVRLFKGNDATVNGIVVSAYYNQNGDLVNDQIPLELAASVNLNNVTIKVPKVGSCNRILNDGETATAVVYSATGVEVGVRQCVVMNTRFIRNSSYSSVYIRGISLKTPFNSSVDPSLIEYHVNATIDSANMMGVVHYSDGNDIERPIDGTKFKILGLNSIMNSFVGQRQPAILTYTLSPEESTFGTTVSANGVVTQRYDFLTVPATGAYSVKLFVFPKWLDSTRGYRLEYWLYTLDRDRAQFITPFVTMAASSNAFDPLLYGVSQTLTVSLDLNDVDPDYNHYIHHQSFDVVLQRPGSSSTLPLWTMSYSYGQNPLYGTVGFAELHDTGTLWTINVGSNATTKEQWLNNIYLRAQPLYNPQLEITPPAPTHIELVFKNRFYEYSVEDWNLDHYVTNDLAQGELLLIRFIKRTVNGDLMLGCAGLPVIVV